MTRRIVQPEWLDELPVTDLSAVRSRRDLRRLNTLMRHAVHVSRALVGSGFRERGRRVIDLGTGDGKFLLKVSERMRARGINAVMVDRLALVNEDTTEQLRAAGWKPVALVGDVFEVLDGIMPEPGTAIIANLFLHHFTDERLRLLLRAMARRADMVVACEPRRSRLALLASRLVGLAGCNAVTRHDAVASVRAGFRDQELTALWGDTERWRVEEKPCGAFSHRFVCRKA